MDFFDPRQVAFNPGTVLYPSTNWYTPGYVSGCGSSGGGRAFVSVAAEVCGNAKTDSPANFNTIEYRGQATSFIWWGVNEPIAPPNLRYRIVGRVNFSTGAQSLVNQWPLSAPNARHVAFDPFSQPVRGPQPYPIPLPPPLAPARDSGRMPEQSQRSNGPDVANPPSGRGGPPRRPGTGQVPRVPRKARKGEKEKKGRLGSPGIAAGILNGLSEGIDGIEALWRALPRNARTPGADVKQKAVDLYNNINQLNIPLAALNLMAEHGIDSMVGRAAGPMNRAFRGHGLSAVGWYRYAL